MTIDVLVVDDEPLVAENLQAFLEDDGMLVQTVGSAEQAIALVERGIRFDVCIMDLRLPGMDGSAAIQTLRRLFPGLRFIIHTGSASFTLPGELKALGIADACLLKKPVGDMDVLANMVRSLAGR